VQTFIRLAGAAISFAALAACSTATGAPPRDSAPLVVELFTSQGCSSCPPADALLAELAHDGALAGRKLAPLSFHVDYWDELGWADPFALPAWTQRQRAYAAALGDDRVYTPELVVGGTAAVVGSRADAVARAIAAAPAQQRVDATARWTAERIVVDAHGPANADVWVAIWEAETHTEVAKGENAGHALASVRVVRRLERVAASGHAGHVEIGLDRRWRDVGAVAFAQRPDLGIVGATELPRL